MTQDAGKTSVDVLVYSDNRDTRNDVMRAVGRRVGKGPAINWTEAATWEGAYLLVEENHFDLLILDGEAAKLGGIGFGKMVRDELVHFSGNDFPCVDSGFGEDAPVDVVVRPEDIMLVGEDIGQISGVVKSVLFKGVHYEMMIDTGETVFKVHSTVMQPQGSRVGINIVPFNIHIMKPMPKEAPKDV